MMSAAAVCVDGFFNAEHKNNNWCGDGGGWARVLVNNKSELYIGQARSTLTCDIWLQSQRRSLDKQLMPRDSSAPRAMPLRLQPASTIISFGPPKAHHTWRHIFESQPNYSREVLLPAISSTPPQTTASLELNRRAEPAHHLNTIR
jgi:hypothetical protein